MVEFGRHERLKISWLHGRAGSSPALRTNEFVSEMNELVQLVNFWNFFIFTDNQKVQSLDCIHLVLYTQPINVGFS